LVVELALVAGIVWFVWTHLKKRGTKSRELAS
jgi:hypothetical protein